jgi:hypothetical protein
VPRTSVIPHRGAHILEAEGVLTAPPPVTAFQSGKSPPELLDSV